MDVARQVCDCDRELVLLAVPVILGDVRMERLAVDLGNDSDDRVGDLAILWGDGLPVEEVAPWADALPYDLVCGVMNREASEIVA